jgi:hypothetical protein
MRKNRRLVVPLAVFALVAAGGVTAGLVANASAQQGTLQDLCSGSGTPSTCTLAGETITSPTAITLVVVLESGTSDTVTVTWTGNCDDNPITSPTPSPTATVTSTSTQASFDVTLPATDLDPASCTLSATATLGSASTDSFEMEMEYTPAAAATTTSPSSVDVSYISGYDGKCLDDKGNSSSKGTEVIIWSCNHGDSAQGWTFSGGELKHNGKCANVKGNGGSGSKMILWTCNGASNETWFHTSSDGEYALSGTSHGLLCLDDPGYSKTNGKQLIVYKCHNSSNQHWSA